MLQAKRPKEDWTNWTAQSANQPIRDATSAPPLEKAARAPTALLMCFRTSRSIQHQPTDTSEAS